MVGVEVNFKSSYAKVQGPMNEITDWILNRESDE
jgi:hypothetical protein